MINTPYNFVPLSNKVVSPYWSKHVSLDIPFAEAQSGSLELRITAKNPIFVRNGTPKKAETSNNDFSNLDGRYFIPGSSIQGTIRSVLEIMSFGRMANKVNDHRYSVRDFQNNNIYNIQEISQTVRCGWLQKVNGKYYLQNCGVPGRISHQDIDEQFGTNMASFFGQQSNLADTKTKSAKFKYDKYYNLINNSFYTFYGNQIVLRYICHFVEEGGKGKKGQIVFTGQPGHRFYNEKRGKYEGKHLEFVFFESTENYQEVSEELIKNFFFAFYDHDPTNQKEDWKWRKPQLDRGEAIPVFFRVGDDKKPIDIGLSYLYKITYKLSIAESINKKQGKVEQIDLAKVEHIDLAETIFGYIEDKTGLKSRVQFCHAFAEPNTARPMQLAVEVLAGPKASFYPTYIAQQLDSEGHIRSAYNTFMDGNAVINGWKRYPIKHSIQHNPPPVINGKVNTKITTEFIPLASNAVFKTSLNYHNLKKEELGAIISAITFHNTAGLFHSFGMAKPLGYGKCTVEFIGLDDSLKAECLKAYEDYMNLALGETSPAWHSTEQLKELLAMAKGYNSSNQPSLPYMPLEDFVSTKKSKTALQAFSIISGNHIQVNSYSSVESIKSAKALHERNKTIMGDSESVETRKASLEKTTMNLLEETFETRKAQALRQLAERLVFIKAAKAAEEQRIIDIEKEEGRKAKALNAQEKGIDLSDIKDLDGLRKTVLIFSKAYHAVNENALLKNFPEGYLPKDAHTAVCEKIIDIYLNKVSKNDKVKWLAPADKNPFYKRIMEWLGKDTTDKLFEQLKSLS